MQKPEILLRSDQHDYAYRVLEDVNKQILKQGEKSFVPWWVPKKLAEHIVTRVRILLIERGLDEGRAATLYREEEATLIDPDYDPKRERRILIEGVRETTTIPRTPEE